MKWNRIFGIVSIALACAAITPATQPQQKTIVETAVSAPNFKTLVAAVKAAGLVETLSGRGPFTVFAPTDEAFAKLEKSKPGILKMLLKPENKAKLAGILTYHVVPGKVLKSDVAKLKNGTKVKTVNGQSIKVSLGKDVHINNARVIATDVLCSNGVIHVIDTVLLPKM